jgi:ribosomal protein L37AE/L43A
MNWLYRFSLWMSRAMSGRHGGDQLSVALLVLYCVLLALSAILRIPLLFYLALAVLVWDVYRMLSRKNERRWKENEWFLRWWTPFRYRTRNFSGRFSAWQQRATERSRNRQLFREFKCPKCGSTLRVPRGKGKIIITCPVCGTEFQKKT